MKLRHRKFVVYGKSQRWAKDLIRAYYKRHYRKLNGL